MTATVSDADLDILFRNARTYRAWKDVPVSRAMLQAVYELAVLGPTNANSQPGRFLFLITRAAKDRLKPHLDAGNVDKTMKAPATVIIGYDLNFTEKLPRVAPHSPKLKEYFADPDFAAEAALQSGTLQGGYLILAARALGLDCGPMSGFNNAGVDKEFFAGTAVKSNFLCNLGHGDPASLFPRQPRLAFDEACEVL